MIMLGKKHFSQIDFIRFVCCIGIIIYHFACHTNSNINNLQSTINSDIGRIIVTIFFIVSGFVLYHNNKEITSLKEFYYKRFKSIFPSFYICWFIFYIVNVIKVRTPFYAGSPVKFLLTLVGQDGYFIQRIVNYYTVGEWFLGALIFVYLLYPLLLKGFRRNDKLTLAILVILTGIVVGFKLPVISPGFPGICESCLKFYLGMMLYKYSNIIDNKKTIVISCIFVVLYTIIKVPFFSVLLDIIYSLMLFILLFNLGEIVMNKGINKSIKEISKLSYQIYLFQHLIIQYLLEIYNPQNILLALVMLMICIVVTIVCAKMLNIIVNKLFKSRGYQKFENWILKR